MLRRAVASLLLAPLLAAGCTSEASGGLDLQVDGAFGARPTIGFPEGAPVPGVRVDEPATGQGARLEPDDVAIVQYTEHVWDGRQNRLVDSSFNRGIPAAFPVGRLPQGLERALRGRTVGSRVIAAIRPEDGGRRGVELCYVVDILGVHRKGASIDGGGGSLAGVRVTGGARPALEVPRTAPPAHFAAKVLDAGGGRRIQAGQLVVAQYAGAVWSSRRSFDGTWPAGQPKAFKIGDGGMIKAWYEALVGVPVGSRVLMIVPPSHGYGAAGHPAHGITGSDTLVYVVDVLAAY
ncbi:FKBP-type peptidyl-prolyl cis-trans isomerase [Nonomuraea sp. H19]|uniref:FKBP-type peptidyl-prolyl cis-trans isomerase n=1 Tax=Nonomuraea sp. H19 TaxID=3452206 RepID=UPI003F8CC814